MPPGRSCAIWRLGYKNNLTMTLPILILPSVLVRHFAPKKFAFWDGQNLLHRIAEFVGRPLDLVNRGRHVRMIHRRSKQRNLLPETWQVGRFIAGLPAPQQFKLDLFFLFDLMLSTFRAAAEMIGTPAERLADFFDQLRVSQLQFRRGHGVNFLVHRSTANC